MKRITTILTALLLVVVSVFAVACAEKIDTERTFANVNASNAENVKIPTVRRMCAKTNARDIPNKNLSLPYCPSTLTKVWRTTQEYAHVAPTVL